MTKEVFNWSKINQDAYEAYTANDFATCERLLKNLGSKIHKLNRDDIRLANIWRTIGCCLWHGQQYKKAIPYFEDALNIGKKHGETELVSTLYWLGLCFYYKKEWLDAHSNFIEAAKLYELRGSIDRNHLVAVLTYAGISLYYAGKLTKAMPIFKKALAYATDESITFRSRGFLCDRLVEIVTNRDKFKKDSIQLLKLYKSAYDLCRISLMQLQAPSTKQINHSDNYFGINVTDSYRWLEDISSKEVQDWVEQQNLSARYFLDNIPARRQIHQQVLELCGEEPYLPNKVGKYYFFSKRMFGRGRIKLFRMGKLGQFPTTVLDGEMLPPNFDIVHIYLSPCGRYVAYAISENGSEWQTLCVKNLITGKDFKEQLIGLRHVSLYWKKDSSGFYYSAVLKNEILPTQRIFFHKLHTAQNKDSVIHKNDDTDIVFSMDVICEGKYLLLRTMRISSRTYSLQLKSLDRLATKILTLLDEQEYEYRYIGCIKNTVYFTTAKGAPMRKLVAIRLANKSKTKPKFIEIIAEQKLLLADVIVSDEYLIASYLTERGVIMRRFDLTGKKLGETRFPEFIGISDRTRGDHGEIFFATAGYTYPKAIFLYKTKTDQISQFAVESVVFDHSLYKTEKLYAIRTDGSCIPVYLSYKKTLKRDGNNPVILTAYGGFDRYIQPSFSSYNIAWMELGGIFAEAVVRGDGNCGYIWRSAGMKIKKQNTFDDFLAVSNYLIKEKFTCPAKLGLSGASNGGLLVAAAVAQRSELFGAVVIKAGLLDMLRFHEFDLAYQYVAEYGSVAIAEEFKVLHAYSPLHTLKKTSYPPVLVIAFANDDRVNPVHSFKFTGALQNLQTGAKPILLSMENNAGHAGHHSSNRGIDELSFFALCLGISPKAILNT